MKEHQQMFYFDAANTQPKFEDADKNHKVLAYHVDGFWMEARYTQVHQYSEFTHWMQMPKAPSDKDFTY
jgi:hypothetical protein